MFSKGADSAMLPLCRLDKTRRKKLQDRANNMAAKSYRTLVLAMRTFDAEMCEALNQYLTKSVDRTRSQKLWQ